MDEWWQSVIVKGRTFRMDDTRDPAVLWDITDGRVRVAEFTGFGEFTPETKIMQAIDEYVAQRNG